MQCFGPISNTLVLSQSLFCKLRSYLNYFVQDLIGPMSIFWSYLHLSLILVERWGARPRSSRDEKKCKMRAHDQVRAISIAGCYLYSFVLLLSLQVLSPISNVYRLGTSTDIVLQRGSVQSITYPVSTAQSPIARGVQRSYLNAIVLLDFYKIIIRFLCNTSSEQTEKQKIDSSTCTYKIIIIKSLFRYLIPATSPRAARTTGRHAVAEPAPARC